VILDVGRQLGLPEEELQASFGWVGVPVTAVCAAKLCAYRAAVSAGKCTCATDCLCCLPPASLLRSSGGLDEGLLKEVQQSDTFAKQE
jgi:hypothetical protein